MTTTSAKDNQHCLVCNSRVGVSTRNSVQIFNKESQTWSERPLSFIMSQVLGADITEDVVHSLLICKKCFKLFDEVDELEQRLIEIKLELVSNYKKSVLKSKNGEENTEDDKASSDGATGTEHNGSNKENESPKKILAIPSSDDETQIISREGSLYTCLLCSKEETVAGNANGIVEHTKSAHDIRLFICDVCGLDFRKRKEFTTHLDEHITSEEGSGANVPKKILDIPSSDDDTQGLSDKATFHTMEAIEMELVKIHGGEDKIEMPKNSTTVQVLDLEGSNHTFQSLDNSEPVDAGAIEHSSDSDYDPRNDSAEMLLQAVTVPGGPKVENIKTEPCADGDEKPNILKRKAASPNNNAALKKMIAKKIKEEGLPPIVTREGNLYTCLLCDREETVVGEAKGIIQHVKVAHDARLYICDVCGQDFRKRNELSTHLDEHVATEEGDFQCEVCNRIFNNLRLFRIHKRMHYPQNKAWTCDLCGKRYSSKNLLDEHINTHTGVRPYVCQICGKDFASKYTFKAHEKTHEVRPRPFQCQQCSKTFLSQQNLTQHERTHSGIKEFACHLCGKQFGSAHNLEVHSIVHTGYKPFVCGLCGKAFARKAEIRDHERTHTGERPYQCEFCGATFSQRSNLQSHKRATHYDDKRYKCDDCGKGFKRRRLLDYHIKAAHTGERPFKCTVCQATFVYPEHFKKHRRIHTGEKPFVCEVCGKAFNSRDNRNAHRFVHSDKKPYECLVCGAGFMRKPLLYQHMQAQGHLNDTIVVNQPRLTTDDDQIITVNADGEMEIVEGESLDQLETIEATEDDVNEDSKLYIAELKEHMLVEGEDVFGNSKGTLIVSDHHLVGGNMEESEAVEHIIIDGQQLRFAEESEDLEEVEEGDQQQILSTSGDDYEEIISSDALANGETQTIDTPEGPIQLVKVRIPNENGEEEDAWIKIVPE